MSTVTVIWSMTSAACLMLAVVNVFIWLGQRQQAAHLVFSVLAGGVAAFTVLELALMHTESTAAYAPVARSMHVAAWVVLVSFVWFTRTYLKAGRPWLGWTVVALRSVVVIVSVFMPSAVQASAIEHVSFLGTTVSAPVPIPTRWMLLAHCGLFLLTIFLIDATWTVWRRGERRRALIVGGSMVVFSSEALLQVVLILWGFVTAPMRISVGYLVMLLAMAWELSRDLQDGARLARQLHEAEQQARLTVSAAGLGYWTWDTREDELWVSDLAREHLGLAGQTRLRMQSFLDTVHAPDRDTVMRAIEKARFDGAEYDVEYRVSRPGGEKRWIASRGSAERSGGNGVLLRSVTLDITERKRADERFRLTIEASPTAIILVDPAGRILLANRRAEALFGYAQDELAGQGVDMLVPPLAREAHSRHRKTFFDAPQARPLGGGRELQALRKDGTEFPVEVGLSPVTTEQGVLVLCAIVDISSRRRTELEIAELRESLSHAGRISTMGQLASALAHEINQPLGAILRNAEAAELVLQQDPPDLDELRAIVADIQSDDQRAGDVIDRLRGLLKRHDIELRPLSVAVLVSEAVALVRPYAAGLNVTLAIGVSPESLQVLGDRIHLEQVILNLLVNGIQAVRGQSPARSRVSIKAGPDQPGMVRLTVADRGCGIAPDRLSRIFEPFFTSKAEGMGMGLPISRTIVEAHGGRIWAEHTPEGGATFHVTLPSVEPKHS